MKITRQAFFHVVSLLSGFMVLFSCSSAPKRAMLVTDSYNLSHSRLELANSELLSGDFDKAYSHLSESYDLALSIDNSSLLAKISLSGVMYKMNSEKIDGVQPAVHGGKSFLDQPLEEIFSDARRFSKLSSEPEKLLALCSLYEVQLKLSEKKGDKNELLSSLASAEPHIKKEVYYTAFLYRTRGDVCMLFSDYPEAEKAYLKAADLHTKNRYLAEIGLDWYSIARNRSLAGNKTGAVEAIENALKFDRDAENSPAIVLDYQAYSKILLKGNPSEAEKKRAEEISLWAQKIHEASKN